MQVIYTKTHSLIFNDLLDIYQLTIAYYYPANLRDLLILSKLKDYKEEIYNIEYHLKGASLKNCIELIYYKILRELDIASKRINLLNKINKSNTLLRENN